MSTVLKYLSFTALTATALSFVVIVFGPQEGLETLAGSGQTTIPATENWI